MATGHSSEVAVKCKNNIEKFTIEPEWPPKWSTCIYEENRSIMTDDLSKLVFLNYRVI